MQALFAQASVDYPSIDWYALSPYIVLLGGGLILLVGGALTPPWRDRTYAAFTVAVALLVVVLGLLLWHKVDDEGPRLIVGSALAFDHAALFATIAIGLSLALVALLSDAYLRREGLDGPDVYGLYMMSALGGLVMVAADDLIVVFLGLETLSLAFYVLAAMHRRRAESQESGLKYFILGGFASAFFLYGIALIYGSTGSTNLSQIASTLSTEVADSDALLLAGIALLMVGLGFKISAVPFHVWTPDVYQGAPTPVTAFMASVGKIAAFAALVRIMLVALPSRIDDWRPVVWVLAVASIVVGSALAAVQTDVKRMLAFSSISHAGFILVGLEAAGHLGADNTGAASVFVYLLIYAVIVIGSFAVVTVVTRDGDTASDLGDFRGLARAKPAVALAFTVLLLAQAGVPVTSGFIAKFSVIRAAADVESYALAVIAMVASVIAAFVYLRIVLTMWFADAESGDDAREPLHVPTGIGVLLVLAVGFTLVAGVFPGWLLNAADNVVAFAR
jgi:NADH-quinone oxidoreductase subunit N